MGLSASISKVIRNHPFRRAGTPPLSMGNLFPDFVATTTMGQIRLHDWSKGSWTFLFVHPLAATPVCTSELVSIVGRQKQFDALNTKVIGLNSSPLHDQDAWHRDCASVFGKEVWFPCIANIDPWLAARLGTEWFTGRQVLPRKTLVLDPDMRVRLVLDYPLALGRNVHEVMRCIEAMQIADRCDVMVPADWRRGDPFVTARSCGYVPSGDEDDVTFLPYLTAIPEPKDKTDLLNGGAP